MNVLEQALRRIAGDLDRRDRKWALVGGFAVSARAEPRFTRDVDVAVAVKDDEAAEQLVRSLLADGYRLLASVEQDATGRLATVRLAPPGPADDLVVVDALFASSGIEPELVRAGEAIEVLPELTVPVARTGHLIALKLLARDDERRPQDLGDLRALLEVAGEEELDLAGVAVRLIAQRGFARGRDLEAALAELMA